MQVFVWPLYNQECVGVMDLGRFITLDEETGSKHAPLDIQIGEMSEESMKEFLTGRSFRGQELQKELEASHLDVGTFTKMKRELKITANVRVGIVEPAAGAKLTLDENKVGVVCDKEKKICHRVNCPEVSQVSTENQQVYKTAAIAVRHYGYRDCEKCQPFFGRHC
jgi:hypothetical protein